MAHVPEDVKVYVCKSCQVTYAGTPVGSGEDRDYEPPGSCSACGENDFVHVNDWEHHYRNR